MTPPEEWAGLVERLEPHVTPEWSKHAREYGEQGWIRLILLVDAHHQLSTPRVAEKVAMTMADLAVDRDKEREGWEALRESAREERMQIVSGMVDASEALLSPELLHLFARSIEPTPPGM
jgi:N6-adenosine-specific RNA methylase IME4